MSAKGRSPGFAAELDRYPDDDLTVILLSHSSSSVTQDPVAEAIAAIVFGHRVTVSNVRVAVLPESVLLSYEGHYQFGPDFFAPDTKFRLIAQPRYLLLQLANDSRKLPLGWCCHWAFWPRLLFFFSCGRRAWCGVRPLMQSAAAGPSVAASVHVDRLAASHVGCWRPPPACAA
jgi:hypothetical protein